VANTYVYLQLLTVRFHLVLLHYMILELIDDDKVVKYSEK